ncbi:TRAP transporter small permease [Brevibacillus sp. TJ4]|uniref:TRAP transporter small permease n=1 Tax=Brevibacillus sp. TJ4 TaxID=3234853 RepID=UPI0037D4021D
MERISKLLNSFLNVFMAVCLALMSILVFSNVVLRYALNSGIPWAEEMSRFLFVWMVFLGAIGALKDHGHLGVDLVIKKLPESLRRVSLLLANLICLFILWLVLDGSWKLTVLSLESLAPATGLPYAVLFGVGIVCSLGMGVVILFHIYQIITGKMPTVPPDEDIAEPSTDLTEPASGGEK